MQLDLVWIKLQCQRRVHLEPTISAIGYPSRYASIRSVVTITQCLS
jgi:hypothetical protein